jgi:hypothetical protein
MAKNFKELQAKMPRAARVRSEEAAKEMISEMGLAELRDAIDLTQESFRTRFMSNNLLSQKWNDARTCYISTLSKITEAMGGELQIIANMPNGRVQIRQFTKIRKGEFKSAPTRPGVSLPSRNRRHD